MARQTKIRTFPIGMLAAQNPWWAKPESIESDDSVKIFRNSKVPWVPRLLYRFDWTSDLIYSLRGPRQIGKTTLLKQLILQFISEKNYASDHLFYFNCENLNTRQELVSVCETFLNSIRRRSKKRVYLFLDEISAVPDWQRGIKYLVDIGLIRQVTILLTGSHSMDIKASSERLPGRRGQSSEVLDKLMLPMKFAEYVETQNPDIHKKIRDEGLLKQVERQKAFQQLAIGKIPKAMDRMAAFLDILQGYYQQYLVTGGIPPVADDYLKSGRIEGSRYRDYVAAVVGDLRRYNKRETYVRQLITRLAEILGNPISWSGLKKGTDIAHHETVADYIEALKDNYTITYLYRLDLNTKGPHYEGEKKIFFRDQFIFHALRTWATGEDPFAGTMNYLTSPENIGRLSENVVCDHVVRLAFTLSSQKHTFEPASSVFYWRSKRNREIDFVVRANGNLIPIECKYQEEPHADDLFAFAEFNSLVHGKSGLMISREILDEKRNAVILPLPLFLLIA